MNLGELKTDLQQILRDPTVTSSFTFWLNDAQIELAMQFDLPGLKLKVPAILTTVETRWLYTMRGEVIPPEPGHTYMKHVFRVANSQFQRSMVLHREIETIDRIDPEHKDTGPDVTRLAIEDDTDDATLAIYPMANDALSLWYYRFPVAMVADTDVPDGIPAAFHRSVLVSKVVLRAFRVYPELALESGENDTRALLRWESELKRGLWGDGFSLGMIDSITKSHLPSIRGPRSSGGNISGADRWSRRSTW